MEVYLIVLIIFLLLLLLGLPVAFTLAIIGGGILFFEISPQMANLQIPQVMYKSLDNSVLVALPLFIISGQVILQSGIGQRIFNAADKWLRHLPGGLAIATILSCAFFAAISGSSVATVVTLGVVASAEMIKYGYPKQLAYGVIAAAGTLGILIPPSGPLILYGVITDQSISDLFIAGIIPGILLTVFFIFYVIISYGKKLEPQKPASWEERKNSIKEVVWVFSLPVVIIGGIYSGLLTVNEAAAVALVISLILGIFVYKTINLRNLMEILKLSAANSGMIMLIVASALLFGFAITIIELPQVINELLTGLEVNKWVIFIIIFIIYAILGMFLEVASVILITIPVLFPIMATLGFDPIWFGIVSVLSFEMAIITPPVGLNLFVMMGISERQGNPMDVLQMSKASLPYIIIIILTIILFSFFPEIITWLPQALKD